MNNTKKPKETLIVAAILLVGGILAVLEGQANWYGVIQIFGGQAMGFGLVCIAFSAALLVIYLRR